MAQVKRVIIDADPGIDDMAAILMALASDRLEVEAITTVFGNASVEQCTVNALRILEAAGRADIPVYQGVGRTLTYREPFYSPHIHGDDGIGNIDWPMPTMKAQERHAVPELIDRALASPGEITLLAIGRQTNVALAVSVEPRFAESVAEIVVMGGSIHEPGNISALATANIGGDPEAADVVYQSGGRVAQVGLDVVNSTEISGARQQRVWDAGTSATRMLEDATKFIRQAYRDDNRLDEPDGVIYSDLSPMAYAIAPEYFELQEMYVRVETGGEFSRGFTVADLRKARINEANISVAMGVDGDAVAELWSELVSAI
jgi:inosine-uridine nucleoside N-ribohydrolase